MLVQLGKEGCKEPQALGCWMKNPDKKQDNNPPTIPQTMYLFRVRTQKRLLKESELTRYYETIGRRLTNLNNVCKTVMMSFTNQ
eukprot:7057508-Ditylum_brightwellii.AAC.1